jgi:hypothetical protein
MNSSIASSSSHPSAPPFDFAPPSYEQVCRLNPSFSKSFILFPQATNVPESELDVSAFSPLYPVWSFGSQPQPVPQGVPSSSPYKMPFN